MIGAANLAIVLLAAISGVAAGGRSPRADGDDLLPRSAGLDACRCCGRTETGAPDRPGEIARLWRCSTSTGLSLAILAARAAAMTSEPTPSPASCSSARSCSPARLSPSIDGRPRCRAGRTARRGRSRFSAHCALLGLAVAELRPGLAARPGARVALHPRRDARRRGSKHPRCRSPALAIARCGVDAHRPRCDRPRRDRRQRLRPRAAVRLRLLPRPGERDAARASAAGRHVLAVRRRHVLRPGRRLPRRSRSPTRGCNSCCASPTRSSSPSCTPSCGSPARRRSSPSSGLAWRSSPISPALSPPFIGYPSTGPLRFGLPWVVILAGTLRARSDAASPPARRDDARSRRGRRRLEHRDLLVLPRGVHGDHRVSLADGEPRRNARASSSPSGSPPRSSRRAREVGATSVVMLSVAGDWPRWTEYLSLVTLYAMRGFGSLLIPAWSPGYLVGALYVLSLTAFVAIPRVVRLAARADGGGDGRRHGVRGGRVHLLPRPLGTIEPAPRRAAGGRRIMRLVDDRGAPYLRTVGSAYRWAAVLAASCVCASLVASNSNAIGGWIDRSPLAQVVRSPPCRGVERKGSSTARGDDPASPRARDCSVPIDAGPTAGRPHPVDAAHGRAARRGPAATHCRSSTATRTG